MNHKYKITFLVVSIGLLFGCSKNHGDENIIDVRVIAFNDFHGALKTPISNKYGGIEYMSTLIKEMKKDNPNNIVVAAGDMVGGSPLLSSMFHDEPTIEALSLAGLEVTSVGNHEFDEGVGELLRKQNGGCNVVTGCQGPTKFKGADFKYLAANVIVNKTGKTLFPEYYIKKFEGIPIAFIGVTLEGTAAIVNPSGTNGLTFHNEAETINALVPKLKSQGVKAIGVLIHEGAEQNHDGTPVDINACNGIKGKVVNVVKQLDHEIDFVVSGHTHQAYNCKINGIPVTSAEANGEILTRIDLKLDTQTKDIIDVDARNIWVDNHKYGKDPVITKLLDAYEKVAAPLASRVIGRLDVNLKNTPNAGGESPLGQVIADSHLYAAKLKDMGNAQIAFVNSGGIRADLTCGDVSYSEVFAVQPFSNILLTKTLTGEQIKRLLEQQWNSSGSQILAVSGNFQYSWNSKADNGNRVIAESMKIDGKQVDMKKSYRVVANEFLATGGDGFSVMNEGVDPVYSVKDVDAMMMYFSDKSPIVQPKANNITRK